MKAYNLVSILILCVGFSCIVHAPEEIEQTDEQETKNVGPYPNKIIYGETTEDHDNSWFCGTELIEAIGPDGKIILMEIPLQCDPISDIYLGCPQN